MERRLDPGSAKLPNERRIGRLYHPNEPVKVIGFEIGPKRFGVDEPFSIDGDWLNGLKVHMRNESDKTIVYLKLVGGFPETGMGGSTMFWPGDYGQMPGVEIKKPSPPLLIKPGETFELAIDQQRFSELKRFIATQEPLSNLTVAILQLDLIIFSDGTGWLGGKTAKPDPDHPDRWGWAEYGPTE